MSGSIGAASVCAGRQGRFWPLYDHLYPAEGVRPLSTEVLGSAGAEVGLDPTRLRACAASSFAESLISADAAEGERAGVTTAPALFVSGRLLRGAAELADDALATAFEARLARP